MKPFFFLDAEDEIKQANEEWDRMCDNKEFFIRQPEDKYPFLFGWMKQAYTRLYEYLEEMQREAND